jgi:hypothetical protein
MLIKFVIIGAIMLTGGVLFSNEISQFLPVTSSNLFDSLKNDFGKIKDHTVDNTETRVEGAIVKVTKEVNEIQEKSSDLLSKSAKEVTDTTQKGLKEITDTTQKTILGGSSNPSTTQNNQNNSPNENQEENNSPTTPNNQNNNSNEEYDGNSSPTSNNDDSIVLNNENTISYETLSLKTTQQVDDSVMLRYEDTSGKTISVSVTLRTTDRELFSGIFYSSMFETFVSDASNTAYFIDMVVEHQEYGTISSSVFNPRDSPNTIINGVFAQS